MTEHVLSKQDSSFLIQNFNSKDLFEPFPLTNVQNTYYLGRFNSFELGNTSAHFYSEHRYAHLDIEKLERTWNSLLRRHLALRTVCNHDQQRFIKNPPYYKIAVQENMSEAALFEIRSQLSHKIYAPEHYPLFDIKISMLQDAYILHLSFDAIIIDLNSLQLLYQEWTKLYQNEKSPLPDIDISYRDYILQLEKIRQDIVYKEAKRYWLKKIDDYVFEMNLPLKASPAEVHFPRFTRSAITIPKAVWDQILVKIEKSKEQGASHLNPTAFLLELFGRILCYWAGQKNLSISLSFFERLPLHENIGQLIGDFTRLELFNYDMGTYSKKSLPSDSDIGSGILNEIKFETINKKLLKLSQNLIEDINNLSFDGIDFQRLLREKKLIPVRQIISPIVFTSLLDCQSETNSVLGASSGTLQSLPFNESYAGIEYAISQTSQIWLDYKAYQTEEGLVCEWDYVDQLFDSEMMHAMHTSYCQLIKHVAEMDWSKDAFPKLKISQRDAEIIEKANREVAKISHDTLFSRYEKTVKSLDLQNAIAVIDLAKNRSFTYRQLIEESELLARYLLSRNTADAIQQIPSFPLIAILSEKGYNQVLACTAIMKSGTGYLPLHIDWPIGRLDEVLSEGKVQIVLISRMQFEKPAIKNALEKKYTLVVLEDFLETINSDPKKLADLNNIQLPNVSSQDIAYVIFTSGSTGRPKGVVISHQAALNTIDAVNRQYLIKALDKVFALSELSFDLSVYDIFGLLAVGASIVFPKQHKTKDPEHWLQVIQDYQVTVWNTVPQLAGLLMDALNEKNRKNLQSLRLFLLSGDWIPIQLTKQIRQDFSNAQIVSLGGATEASIWSIWYEITQKNSAEYTQKIPYGIAMPNQKMYVLNEELEHCPTGMMGEIYIGGAGVALGYLGSNVLTESRFIIHNRLGRLYKTGDLGRWHPAGYMEFMGRNDFQVKINGYRVELEEIAAKLTSIEGVQEAFVKIYKQDHLNYLLGYILPKKNEPAPLEQEYLNAKLAQYLPDYMLPSHYVILNELPLSANGKLDLNAAPKPTLVRSYHPPENELQEKLTHIWSEILGLPYNQIGIHDNFFNIGGNSLMAVQLVMKLKMQLEVQLELMNLKNINIDEIAKRLQSQAFDPNAKNTAKSNFIRIKEGDPNKQLPLILIHPTGGDIYFYYGIASTLPDDQPVYAIRSPLLEGQPAFESIEEMASAYLQLLEKAEIKPPYVLGGSSFGGIVAYHMAQILHTQNIYTPLLVLVDAPAYGNMPRALSEQEILEFLIKYGLNHLDFSLEDLRSKKTTEEQIQYMADQARSTELKDMISTEFLPLFIRTWQANTDALLKYVPNFYSGNMVFFSHTETIEEFPTNQHLHWIPYAKGQFKYFTSPGNHVSMNAPPFVAAITGHMYEAIAEVTSHVQSFQENEMAI